LDNLKSDEEPAIGSSNLFLRMILPISWTEKKSNVEVMTAAGVQRELMKTSLFGNGN